MPSSPPSRICPGCAVLTFQCLGCDEEFPASHGLARGPGRVCQACAPQFAKEQRPGLARRVGTFLLQEAVAAFIIDLLT